MKIEKIDHILSSDEDASLVVSLLIHRIGDELSTMSTTCRNVENALGIVIGSPENPVDQSIIAIQGLDRLRQTLEDLARLSRIISRTKTLTTITIPTHEVSKAVVLTGLVERLTRSKSYRSKDGNDEQDVIWV